MTRSVFVSLGLSVFFCIAPAALAGWAENVEHNIVPLWDPPYELDGAGFTIAMWDGGAPDILHPEYPGRVSLAESGIQLNHPTHIAGMLIAAGASPSDPFLTRAPAYRANLRCWDFNDVPNEFIDACFEGAVSACNAWSAFLGWWYDPNPSGMLGPGWRDAGGGELFGAYITDSMIYDDVIYALDDLDLPFVVAFPAGDDRAEGKTDTAHDGTWFPDYPHVNPFFDCVNPVATGKNVITVGATDSTPNEGVVTDYSCWGPTDDGRIKPDLVARGDRVYSSMVVGSSLYGNLSGTAQATAVVSSAAVLVMQQYARTFGSLPGAADVKTLLIHTADDRGPQGPDYLYGFGSLDARRAVDTIVLDGGYGALIKKDSVGEGQTATYVMQVPSDTSRIKMTLGWIDPAGSLSSPLAIVNDLDLRLTSPSDQVFHPYSLSRDDPTALATDNKRNEVDTIEQVVIADPQPGLWQVEVVGTGVPLWAPQAFSLASDTALDRGAPEPRNVVFNRAGDGTSVEISWDPIADSELVELRVFRSSSIGQMLERVATLPRGTTSHVDTPPSLTLLAYDVRAVYDRGGVRRISSRGSGLQTSHATILSPRHLGTVAPDDDMLRIIGQAEPFSAVSIYEGSNPGVEIEVVTTMQDGLFFLDHDFGNVGEFTVIAQAQNAEEGIAIPSLEVEFEILP